MARYADIHGLAEHFAISVSTARKWVRDGVIPDDTYIKVRGTYRFDLDRVDTAIFTSKDEDNQP